MLVHRPKTQWSENSSDRVAVEQSTVTITPGWWGQVLFPFSALPSSLGCHTRSCLLVRCQRRPRRCKPTAGPCSLQKSMSHFASTPWRGTSRACARSLDSITATGAHRQHILSAQSRPEHHNNGMLSRGPWISRGRGGSWVTNGDVLRLSVFGFTRAVGSNV